MKREHVFEFAFGGFSYREIGGLLTELTALPAHAPSKGCLDRAFSQGNIKWPGTCQSLPDPQGFHLHRGSSRALCFLHISASPRSRAWRWGSWVGHAALQIILCSSAVPTAHRCQPSARHPSS